MTANQILIIVIGLFLVLTGAIYLIHLRGNKEATQREKVVSLVLLVVGILVVVSPFLLVAFNKAELGVNKTRPSYLQGSEFYQNPAQNDLGSHEKASVLYEKAVGNWNAEKSGYDSSEIVMERLDRSIAMFETAHAYTARGQLKVQLSLFKSALKDYNKALEIDPKFGNAYYNRATIHYIMGDNELACADWKSANELGVPNTEETLKTMCY